MHYSDRLNWHFMDEHLLRSFSLKKNWQTNLKNPKRARESRVMTTEEEAKKGRIGPAKKMMLRLDEALLQEERALLQEGLSAQVKAWKLVRGKVKGILDRPE